MKRSSGDKSVDVIDISDDESPSKQPPQKTVKKDAQQFSSPAILCMQEHFAKLDNDYQGACRLAAEAQQRVAFLENLLEKKHDASKDTEKEELKKRLTEVCAKLEEATRKNGEMIKKDCENAREIDKLKADIVELKKISEFNRHLAQLEEDAQEKLMQSKNKLIEDLQMKIAETSAELEKEKCKAAIREEQLNRLAKLEKDFQGVCRIANEYEMGMNEAKARVIELENIIDKKPIIAPVVPDNTEKNNEIRIEQNRLSEAVDGSSGKVDAMPPPDLMLSDLEPVPPRKPLVPSTTPNLFDPCSESETSDSLSFESARALMRTGFHKKNSEWRSNCCKALSGEVHACTACNKGLMFNTKIVNHFFCKEHANKMREVNAEMPRATFEYWMAKLDSIPKPSVDPVAPLRPTLLLSHTPNLFEPCSERDTSGSMPFVSALDQLRSKFFPGDDEWRLKCTEVLRGEVHICTLCKKGPLSDSTILCHFFSKGHAEKMRARNAVVPRSTFEYWMAKLDSIPKPAPRPATTPKATVAPKATVTPKVPKNGTAKKLAPANVVLSSSCRCCQAAQFPSHHSYPEGTFSQSCCSYGNCGGRSYCSRWNSCNEGASGYCSSYSHC